MNTTTNTLEYIPVNRELKLQLEVQIETEK